MLDLSPPALTSTMLHPMVSSAAQKYCVLFWTNSEISTPQNSSCTATYLPSHQPSIKTNKTSRVQLGSKDISKQRSYLSAYTEILYAGAKGKKYIHLVCEYIGGLTKSYIRRDEDEKREKKRERERESKGNTCCQHS